MPEDNRIIVDTQSGRMRGVRENGLLVFKGIPYAAAPVGELRWQPPQRVRPWTGTRSAEAFGAIAPQIRMPMGIMRPNAPEEPQDEDCLYLNVWTPGLDGTRWPVMVWVHGGGFSNGSGSSPEHHGNVLAKRGNIVVVTINYRLGPPGFLCLKELTDGVIPSTGNEGLFDQVAALRWVKDNIAAFGGDPGNVTVFGESAGAMSVGCLLVMPAARGLFHKAILQSGVNTVRPLNESLRVTEKFLDILGVSRHDPAALMSINAQRLVAAHTELTAALNSSDIRGAASMPTVDGETLPDFPVTAARQGAARNIPVIVGTNLDEMKILYIMDQSALKMDEAGLQRRLQHILRADYIPKMVEDYRDALSKRGGIPSPADILMAIWGDQVFRAPSVRLLEAQTALGALAYSYLFTWRSPAPGLDACHALDVGFVFGRMNADFHGSGPMAERLARRMQDAWIAFAGTGDPSCDAVGTWPVYGQQRRTMVLGEELRVKDDPYSAERRAWDGIPDDLIG